MIPRLRRMPDVARCMMEFVVYPGETVFVPSGWYVMIIGYIDWIVVKPGWCYSSQHFRV